MSRISTYASNSLLLQQTLRTQQRVHDGQIAISSEKKSQTYDGIYSDARRLVNVENTNNLLLHFISNNNQAEVSLGITDTVVEGIRDTLNDFKASLLTYNTDKNKSREDTDLVQNQAFSAMVGVQSLLNTDVDGKFLFSGGRASTPPVNLGLVDLSEFQSRYDGAIFEYPTTRDAHLDQLSTSEDSVTGSSNWLSFENDVNVSTRVSASAGANAGEIVLTGKDLGETYATVGAAPTMGTTLDNTSSTSNTAAATMTTSKQVDLLTISGTIEAGDQYTVSVDGNSVTYTVNGTEASIADVRAGLTNAINANTAMAALVTATSDVNNSGNLTLTAVTPGKKFATVATTPTTGATVDNTVVSRTTTTNNGLTTAQIDTVTIAGAKETGDQYTVNVNGNAVTYTVLAGDADLDAIRNKIVDAVNADSTLGAIVVASVSATTGEFTMTAKVPGETFTTTMSTPTVGATMDNTATSTTSTAVDVVKTSQVNTVTIAGTIEAGDKYSVVVNGNTVTYTVTGAEANIAAVRSAIVAQINVDPTVNGLVTAADATANTQFTLTSDTPGDAFTASVSLPATGATTDNAINSVVSTENRFTMAQQDVVSLAGTIEAGDQYRITVDGTPVTYTVTGAETSIADVRAGLVTAINADGTLGPLVTAAAGVGNGELTITSDSGAYNFTTTTSTPTTGTTADNTLSSITKNNIITTAQVDTVKIAGTVEVGDQYTFDVDGNAITYTVSVTDTSLQTIRANIISAINADPKMSAIVEAGTGSTDGELTLSAKTRGKAFKTTLTTPTTGTTADNTSTFTTTTTSGIQIAQVDTLTIAGSVEIGDVYTLEIDGVTATYTVTGAEAGLSDIRDGLINAINSDINMGVSRITSTSAEFAGMNKGSTFTVSGSVDGLNDGTYTVGAVSSDGKSIDIVSRQLTTATAAQGVIEFKDQGNNNARVVADDPSLTFTRNTGSTPDKITYTDNSLDGITIGQKIIVSDASIDSNNGDYTVLGIDTTSNTILVKTQRFSDQGSQTTPFFTNTARNSATIFTDGGTGKDTISSIDAGFFSGVSQGMAITVSNSTFDDGTYIVDSVSADGKTLTLATSSKLPVGNGGNGSTDSRTPTFTIEKTTGTVKSTSYYAGDQVSSVHRVDKSRSFINDLNAADPAFEKIIRGLAIIAQGQYGSEGGLDQNTDRIDAVIALIDGAINRNTSNKSPFGVQELTSSLEKVQIDIGYRRILIQDTNEINSRYSSFLKTNISDMENIDITEAITKMLDDQQALEASFQVFAKIKQLSLTNFL